MLLLAYMLWRGFRKSKVGPRTFQSTVGPYKCSVGILVWLKRHHYAQNDGFAGVDLEFHGFTGGFASNCPILITVSAGSAPTPGELQCWQKWQALLKFNKTHPPCSVSGKPGVEHKWLRNCIFFQNEVETVVYFSLLRSKPEITAMYVLISHIHTLYVSIWPRYCDSSIVIKQTHHLQRLEVKHQMT